jgi:serine/threonine-protein kinase RsbW
MPAPTSEDGRGLAIARKALDELAYKREGEVNTWRLVKRL